MTVSLMRHIQLHVVCLNCQIKPGELMILLPVFLQIFSSISDSIAKTNIWVFPTSLLINSQLGLLLCRLGWLFVWQMCQFSSSEKRGIAHIFLPVSFPPTGKKSKDSKRCGGVKIHRERIREHSCVAGKSAPPLLRPHRHRGGNI